LGKLRVLSGSEVCRILEQTDSLASVSEGVIKSCKSSRRQPQSRFPCLFTTRTAAYHDFVKPMKVREVIRLLEKNGWVEIRPKGRPSAF
jgi:predicted RNA binding protein YcfA (HicA-like mRNA interferase family)